MKQTLELNGTTITFEASANDAETVRCIATELIGMRGFVNLDAEDIAEVLDGAKVISVGEGIGSGEDRVKAAALEAMKNTPGISGAKSLIVEVVSGVEIFLAEISDAAFTIELNCEEAANVVWGHLIDEAMEDNIRLNIIAVA
ncbi:MAG: hypothetical protein II877_06215 [Synergistaceae bacterium]|nr:hypothetical protein [Synergistaceae bacterium]MBR0256153.1 hypothetical protein [Synergistaceae bacterium]